MSVIVEKHYKNFEEFFHSLLDSGSPEPPRIWRGQANAEWQLESSISRLLRKKGNPTFHLTSYGQFVGFQQAARGRISGGPISTDDMDEWLALGQHYGLATPLLDWTRAPFIATFFAFVTEGDYEYRAVFSLDLINLDSLNDTLKMPDNEKLRIVYSKSANNPRLIAQRALFTYCPYPYIIEDWLQTNVLSFRKTILTKHIVPGSCRESVLRTLNRMNVNYLSLFPDLMGAALHVNLQASIEGYA